MNLWKFSKWYIQYDKNEILLKNNNFKESFGNQRRILYDRKHLTGWIGRSSWKCSIKLVLTEGWMINPQPVYRTNSENAFGSYPKYSIAEIWRGMHQGCCISPILFSLYREWFVKGTLEEVGDRMNWSILIRRWLDAVREVIRKSARYDWLISENMKLWNGNQYRQIKSNENIRNRSIAVMHCGKQRTRRHLPIQIITMKDTTYQGIRTKSAFTKKRKFLTSNLCLELRKKLIKYIEQQEVAHKHEHWEKLNRNL